MRKAINENPKVQAGVIAFLLIAGVLLFMKMSKSADTGAATTETADPAATATATGTGAGAVSADGSVPTAAPGATTGAPITPTAAPIAPTAATAVSPEALVPGPGLPGDVVQAFRRGDAVVLLIVKPGSTDDDLVRDSVGAISRSGVSVFVTSARNVARYSRITQGVGLSRVPALIVVRPRNAGGDAPEATVSYGFRDSQSIVQAVEDALYTGPDDVPYHPG
jgi:hypothetical protein